MENETVLVKQTRSETIGKLAEALSKAQGLIEGAKKDTENPFFKKPYADLASVWGACRKPLSDNGLAIIQLPSFEGEFVDVETILVHASGEFISCCLALKPIGDDPQKVGSAISYGRRYGLASIVGIYQEDDDANSSSGNTLAASLKSETATPSSQKPQQTPTAAASFPTTVGEEVGVIEKLAAKQKKNTDPPQKYLVFQFNGKGIFVWDKNLHPAVVAAEGQKIAAIIQTKGDFRELISFRVVKPDIIGERQEEANDDIPF